MKRRTVWIGGIASLCCLLIASIAFADGPAWILTIDGEINSGTVYYLNRGLAAATEEGAGAVVLVLTTPGGYLDAAIESRRALLDATVPTIAYVEGEAFSAGAAIAIACEAILFSPGGVLGAATPVTVVGQDLREAPEKVISATRSLFRAAAELRGRPPEVAEAMVDPDVSIPGLIDRGKLLTLTAQDAATWGYSDGETDSIETWLTERGYEEQIEFRIRWIDELVEALTSPLAVGLLITVGLLGLIVEMLVPGFGVPGLIGIVCLGAFFWTHVLVGLAGWESIAFLLGGVVAVILEVFAFTAVDFGITGLLGLVLIGLGFYTAMVGPFTAQEQAVQAIGIVAGGLIVSLVAAVVLLTRLPRTRLRLGGIILSSAVTGRSHDKQEAEGAASDWIGRRGVATTDLRPIGAGTFDEDRIDVVCEEGFLPKGTPIVVIRDEQYRTVVRRIDKEEQA
jgi:membrane-bound serine protease (ClpP class)